MTDLSELRQLELIERAVNRRGASIRTGATRSLFDEELDEHSRSIRERNDIVSVEATEIMLLFLRQLFSQKQDLLWKGDGSGGTHLESQIIVESHLASAQRDHDMKKPVIHVRPGPNTNPETVIGGLKHYDLMTDTKTYTDLEVGTLRIDCKATTGAAALTLAKFVSQAILTMGRAGGNLTYRAFHKITNVTTGGWDPAAAAYNRQVEGSTHAVVPVTLTYYWQYTTRVSPRDGLYDLAEQVAISMGLLPEYDGGPFVDDKTDGVVQSRETLVVLPVELDDD